MENKKTYKVSESSMKTWIYLMLVRVKNLLMVNWH